AWKNNLSMDPTQSASYQWAACIMEPWDGLSLFTFSNGFYCGANLNCNNLQPCFYPRLLPFGYTLEKLDLLMRPMVSDGKEALESIFMLLECYVGPEGNLLAVDESLAGRLALPSSILTIQEFRALQDLHTFKPLGHHVLLISLLKSKVAWLVNPSKPVFDCLPYLSSKCGPSCNLSACCHWCCASSPHQKLRISPSAFCWAMVPHLAKKAILKLRREVLIKVDLTKLDLINNFCYPTNNGILKVM
ncbi:uncharacterized protein VP01_7797g1, partial [Puccinia sorghi]